MPRRNAENGGIQRKGKLSSYLKFPQPCAEGVAVVWFAPQGLFGNDDDVVGQRHEPVDELRTDDHVGINPNNFLGALAQQLEKGLRLGVPGVRAGWANCAHLDRRASERLDEFDQSGICERTEQNDCAVGFGANKALKQKTNAGFAQGPVLRDTDRGTIGGRHSFPSLGRPSLRGHP